MAEGARNGRVSDWLDRFNAALESGNPESAAGLFKERGHWRDFLSFTWNIKTMEGREGIRSMLECNLKRVGARNFRTGGEAWDSDGAVGAFLTFESNDGSGVGVLHLGDDGADALLTTLDALEGHDERKGSRRETGVRHGTVRNRTTWREARERDAAELGVSREPYALIVGGGQGGLALAARLRRLGVPTLIVEKNARPGDSWRRRYKTLVLHDPVWYDHLPYLPFPDDWPVFTPKDKMGDWLEAYASIMELDFWGSAECTRASFDELAGEWRVEVVRHGVQTVLRPKQLILCTGAYGPPRIPEIEGADSFRGSTMHSSDYQSGEVGRGKRCVVVGSNTSAHDICADLWESGASEVTMIQRSSSTVVRSSTLLDVVFGDLYSERALENGVTTEKADLMFASIPIRKLTELHKTATTQIEARDAELLDRLRQAGFLLDSGCDGSGLVMKAFRTGSGYYIDVGCSELIASGEVAVRSGVEPAQFTGDGLVLSDGSSIEADLVVYATGYHTMQETIRQLISDETADEIGHCWGYGSGTPGDPGPWEGEMRNLWKPTAQRGLWLHGGNLHLSRFFSKYLALQVKARMEGIPTPVYGRPSNSERG